MRARPGAVTALYLSSVPPAVLTNPAERTSCARAARKEWCCPLNAPAAAASLRKSRGGMCEAGAVSLGRQVPSWGQTCSGPLCRLRGIHSCPAHPQREIALVINALLFDPDYNSKRIQVVLKDVTPLEALRIVGERFRIRSGSRSRTIRSL